jgi:hypothetical protein
MQFSTILLATSAALLPLSLTLAEEVNYNRDIRPLLSENCYKCHGPDDAVREAELRLDTEEGAFRELPSGGFAAVRGDSSRSKLHQRISTDDPAQRMPPPDSGKVLTPEQISLVKTWLDQGAAWREHWAFLQPERPPEPQVPADWTVRNPIDSFILSRLQREGLEPSAEADKYTLVRRVTLDLTGLPPTIAEVDAFVEDASPHAYEKLVDRLLASSRYGEHQARYWLDAARYGDTHGLHVDNERSLWPYRDWVISAFNNNMPFDQFTIQQLAGDLMSDPTREQLIATGFNRCNVSTSEGGAINEEFLVRYAVDRVETTSTVWMGLTLGCAACHEHKFDPFSQKEFYELFAFFFSLTEQAMDGNALLPPPYIRVPTPAEELRSGELKERIDVAEKQFEQPLPVVDAAQTEWESSFAERLATLWQAPVPVSAESKGGATLTILEDGSVLATGQNPETDVYELVLRTDLKEINALRVEVLVDEPGETTGRAEDGNFVLSELEVTASAVTSGEDRRELHLAAAHADESRPGFDAQSALDGLLDTGWAVDAGRWESRSATFTPLTSFGFEGGTELKVRLSQKVGGGQNLRRVRLSVTTDVTVAPPNFDPWYLIGPFEAEGEKDAYETAYGPESEVDVNKTYRNGKLSWALKSEFVNGKIHALGNGVGASYLYRILKVPTAREIELSLGSSDALKVWLNGELVLDRNVKRAAAADQDKIRVQLRPSGNSLLVKVVNYSGARAFYFEELRDRADSEILDFGLTLALAKEKRSDAQRQALRDHYRKTYAPELEKIYDELSGLRGQKESLTNQMAATLIMEEMEIPRAAFVLNRGEYDKKGEKVEPSVPAVFPSLPEDAPANRLGLARWLVRGDHPLVARVIVNRFWQQYFGTGIVKTAENFGSQGEWPVHPELLDWLAVEFVESGWDVKHLQRLLVTAASYRQSSHVRPEIYDRDPENRLLARAPRFRVDAEMLRDSALAMSGLLVERIGGRSVKPYQPLGLWKAIGLGGSNTRVFTQDHGTALYRRSLYTFWKRTSPPPTMSLFDAPSREICTVRRPRTNTPLQALALLNDVQFVETARHMARRIMVEGGVDPDERIRFGWRLATARPPSAGETQELRELLEQYQAVYAEDKEAALELVGVGDSEPDGTLDAGDLAAWTLIANLILNLDETVTKG